MEPKTMSLFDARRLARLRHTDLCDVYNREREKGNRQWHPGLISQFENDNGHVYSFESTWLDNFFTEMLALHSLIQDTPVHISFNKYKI